MKIDKYLSNFSIRKKILIGFSIIIFIIGITAVSNYYQINKINDLREQVIPLSSQISSLQEFAISLESLEKNVDKIFKVGYREDEEKAYKDIEKMLSIIEYLKKNSDNNLNIKLQEIEEQLVEIKKNLEYIANLESNSENARTINEKRILVYEIIDNCRHRHRELLSEITATLRANVQYQKQIIAEVMQYSLMVALIAVGLGTIISLVIAKSISRPIEKLRDATIEIGKGNFDNKINLRSNDEVGELADSLNRMAVDLQRSMEYHKRIEEARIENERLVFAGKAKSEFLANMSHELRTPLNAIIGFSELLRQKGAGGLNEKQMRYVENVIGSSNHLLKLISDILDLTKVEAGKLEVIMEKIPLAEAINESIILIKEKASKHNIILETRVDPKLEFIEADRLRFKQILFNLLSNAVKFSKPEGGKIKISASKEGDVAKISVSDTGIGIKEEDMSRLFNTFDQLDPGISRHYGGSGLGLSISKKLVEIHNGRIWAESAYGKGTTFIFTLPIIAKTENMVST